MKLGNVWIVFRKEFLDVLRDRRTLFSMILLPIVVFPFLTLGVGSFFEGQYEKLEQRSFPVIVLGSKNAPELMAALGEEPGLQLIPSIEDSALALEMLLDQTVQAVLCIPPDFGGSVADGSGDGNPSAAEIWYDKSHTKSGMTERKLRNKLADYREDIVRRNLEARGLSYELVEPFTITSHNQASQSKMTGATLGMLLPYMVILLAMVGSTYSAIDLTAGEKERGTMETLLVCPASRLELVLGKFLTTMLVGFITAILAVISFSATLLSPGSFLSREIGGGASLSLDPFAYGMVFLLLLPVTALFAAALIAIAVNARSYKEAQSYVYPLILIIIFPAIASMLPGVEVDMRMALVPVLNVSLALRDAILGTFNLNLILLTFASSALYAAFAIFVAVRIFQKESVLLRT